MKMREYILQGATLYENHKRKIELKGKIASFVNKIFVLCMCQVSQKGFIEWFPVKKHLGSNRGPGVGPSLSECSFLSSALPPFKGLGSTGLAPTAGLGRWASWCKSSSVHSFH